MLFLREDVGAGRVSESTCPPKVVSSAGKFYLSKYLLHSWENRHLISKEIIQVKTSLAKISHLTF